MASSKTCRIAAWRSGVSRVASVSSQAIPPSIVVIRYSAVGLSKTSARPALT